MGIQLVLGSSGAGKSHWLYETVIQESMKHTDKKYLVLVPEQFTLQTQKDLVSMHPNQGIMNIDVLSFMRLAYHVFDEVGGNARLVLEDTGKSMIVKKVAMDKRNELVLFGANVKKQGFIDEMKSIISEFLQYSIHEEQLEQMLKTAEHKKQLTQKLKDIGTIYSAYEDFLKDRYINAEELLDVLCDVILKSDMVKDSVICLDGFTGFTPSQYHLLSRLMVIAEKIYVTVTIDPRQVKTTQKEHELFYLSQKTIQKLYNLADEANVEIEPPQILDGPVYRFVNSEPLQALEHNLFRYPYEVYDKEQHDVCIHSAKNADEEVKDVLIEIKRLIKEEDYRYKDIAIVTGDIETYAPLLKKQCNLLKISYFIDYKKNIEANPAVEFVRAVIELVEQDFSYDGVMRFLKCGLVPYEAKEVELFENYLLAKGIRGFYAYQKDFLKTYPSAYDIHLSLVNDVRSRLEAELKPVYQSLSSKSATVLEKVTALYELMVSYHVEEQILAMANQFKEGDLNQDRLLAKEYEQVYRMILDVFDRMAELLGSDVITLREFKDILETGLKEAKVGLIPPGIDQVVIGDIERTRLKDIKALFFIGVNDGVVPKVNPGGGILSETERQLFADHEIELSPTKRQNVYLTEFYLYLNLTKPQNRLYLSYARVDSSGKTIRPSYFISKIKKLFPKLVVDDPKDYEQIDELDRILGTDQGLHYLITNLRTYDGSKLDRVFHELYCLYRNHEIASKVSLSFLYDAVLYHNKDSKLSKEAAKKLYGEVLAGSVTRLETYASCAFAHFMEFGLNLEERKEFKVSIPELGSIFHKALELFSQKLKEEKVSWSKLTEEQQVSFGRKSIQEAVDEYNNGIFDSSKRNAYMVARMERILLKTIQTLAFQLRKGTFEPEKYEQFFSHADRFLQLHGRIDRIDVYEEDQKRYVKVIDYKSGSTTFDLVGLYYGLQIQLGVYLSAALSLLKEEHPEDNIVPAGVFYYNLSDPIVDKSDHIEQDIVKKLKMNGLVNRSTQAVWALDTDFFAANGGFKEGVSSDVIPVETGKDGQITKRSSVATQKQMGDLQAYLTELMHQFSVEIMDGNIEHNPYRQNKKEACSYCKFKDICGFDCKIPGYEYRRLEELSSEEIFHRIERDGETADGEDGMDNTAEKSN